MQHSSAKTKKFEEEIFLDQKQKKPHSDKKVFQAVE